MASRDTVFMAVISWDIGQQCRMHMRVLCESFSFMTDIGVCSCAAVHIHKRYTESGICMDCCSMDQMQLRMVVACLILGPSIICSDPES